MSSGFDARNLLDGLAKARKAKLAAATRAVNQFNKHVVGDAAELAPVKTGMLKASATTIDAEVHGGHIVAQNGFNTDYAAAVHERLEAHHDQGQAKFLTEALQKNAGKFGSFVADAVKAVES